MYETAGVFVTPDDCFEEQKSMRIGYVNHKRDLIDGLAAISTFSQRKNLLHFSNSGCIVVSES